MCPFEAQHGMRKNCADHKKMYRKKKWWKTEILVNNMKYMIFYKYIALHWKLGMVWAAHACFERYKARTKKNNSLKWNNQIAASKFFCLLQVYLHFGQVIYWILVFHLFYTWSIYTQYFIYQLWFSFSNLRNSLFEINFSRRMK